MVKYAPIKDGQVKVGDWILASKGNKLSIHEVRYINPLENGWSNFGIKQEDVLCTDGGNFTPSQVIELRR